LQAERGTLAGAARYASIVAATTEHTGVLQYPYDFDYPYGQSSGAARLPATLSGLTPPNEHGGNGLQQRESVSSASSAPTTQRQKGTQRQGRQIGGAAGGQRQVQRVAMDSSEGAADTPGATGKAAQDSKPKRVRTGCLTCRQRHLKCDEGKPICQNCRKSNRTCVTGVRLNFIDTQVKRPPLVAPAPADYQIAFCDDSRDIASEYAGGLAKYGPVEDSHIPPDSNNMFLNMQQHSMPPPSSATHQSLPPIQGILPEAYPQETHDLVYEHQSHRASSHRHSSHSHSESSYTVGGSSYGGEHTAASNDAPRNYLDTQEEVLFMQVFVEEVGLWMDSMDPMKHVGSRLYWSLA
jgi:hypothetical protein